MSLAVSSICIVNNVFSGYGALLLVVDYLNFAVSFGMSSLAIISNIFAHHGAFVNLIVYLYVAMSFCIARSTVVDNVVSFNITLWRFNRRIAIQLHIVGFTVVCSIVCMHNLTSFSMNNRFSQYVHQACIGISARRRSIDIILRRVYYNIAIEVCIVCFGVVIALVSDYHAVAIGQCATSTEVIGYI